MTRHTPTPTSTAREALRLLASRPVAMIHPQALPGLYRTALSEDMDAVIPIGDNSQAPEAEEAARVLVLPVRGTIVHHWTDGFERWGMVTPTDWLIEGLRLAAEDDAVVGVALDISSPGGMAVGTPEAAEAIYRFRETKPIIALANGDAYSAAYYLGAAADKFYVLPSGAVGSIGTLVMYQNVEKMLEEWGISIDILRATDAENKARFNPFEPLSDDERDRVVATQLDPTNDRFLADVARFRGLDSEDVAEISEMGRIFLADQAVERGLVDGVATLAEVVEELGGELIEPEEMGGEDEGEDEGSTATASSTGTDLSGITVKVDTEGVRHKVDRLISAAVQKERIASRIQSGDLPEGVEVRGVEAEARAIEDADHPLQGAGVRFDSLSGDLGGFVEKFAPGAFDASFESDDIRVVWQHDRRYVFGRVKADTARAWADDEACRYSADPPDAQWARDAMESIRRGDVDQSSFLFVVEDKQRDQRFERRDDGMLVRTVLKARLIELGPQTYPAYEDTSVAIREARAWEAREAKRPSVRIERERLELEG